MLRRQRQRIACYCPGGAALWSAVALGGSTLIAVISQVEPCIPLQPAMAATSSMGSVIAASLRIWRAALFISPPFQMQVIAWRRIRRTPAQSLDDAKPERF